MTAIARLSRADQRAPRLAELRDTDRDMRKPGTLAAPDEPVPLHRANRETERTTTS
jgi:hypothetical protein